MEYLEQLANSGNSYLILIGPEGALSDEEILIAKGKQFKAVKLSNYCLRRENVGVVASTMLNNTNH